MSFTSRLSTSLLDLFVRSRQPKRDRKQSPLAASRPKLKLLLPLYSYPNWYYPDRYLWTQVAAVAGLVEIVAIINPENGPGGGPPNTDYQRGIADLRRAGIKLVGYIHTDYGRRQLQSVKTDIDIYARHFEVDGIFIDEVSTDPDRFGYNRQIDRYAKSYPRLQQTILNPGTTIDENYLRHGIGDTIAIFENDRIAWDNYQPPAYLATYPRSRFAALVHTTASTQAMVAIVDRALKLGFGYIYVTDAHNFPPNCNPWDKLPSYWQQEVNLLTNVF
jgi:hypothetical protein